MPDGRVKPKVLQAGKMSESERQLVREIYSDVLFELAENSGSLEPVLEDLKAVRALFRQEPEFATLLVSHAIKGEEKAQIIRRVFGGRISELAVSFLSVLARRGRMGFLDGIEDRYQLLIDAYRNRVLVEVTLASEPDDEHLDRLRHDLAEAISSEVKLKVRIEPGIIGGIIIKKGESVIDHSLKSVMEKAVKAVADRQKKPSQQSPGSRETDIPGRA